MKEYTYTNKAYLGIKEGIVPPTPQYLWINSKDNKLYKFGNNGWEVTNNAPYIVEEFTARDLASLASRKNPVLTISRDFLDAMYKGLPIMVKAYSTYNMTTPVSVDAISNPSNGTQFIFRVKFNNIEYRVVADGGVITDTKVLSAVVTAHNLVDWNENDSDVVGYIANRTHYLKNHFSFIPGHRVTVSMLLDTDDIEDYRIKIGENLYKLPKTMNAVKIGDDKKNFEIQLMSISQSGKILSYTYNTSNPTGFFGENCTILALARPLDPVYLQNEALTWNYIRYVQVLSDGSIKFNTGDAANQLYNKDLYMINASTVGDKFSIEIGAEHNKPDSVKEYKFIVANNKTEISPTVFFVDGIGSAGKPQIKVIGNSSPNCEIHVKLMSGETGDAFAIIEYKPFNS